MKSITFVSQSTEIDQVLDDPPESADASEYCCHELAFYRQESNFLYARMIHSATRQENESN